MTITMSDAMQFHGFYKTIGEKKMPLKVAYKLNTVETEIEKKLAFYEATMKDIISKYAEKDADGNPVVLEDGNSIKIKQESIPQCQTEINELSDLEVEISDIKFTLNELEGIELKLQEIKNLMPFIKEE